MRVLARQLVVQFFRGDVFLFEEELKNQFPLPGVFQLMLSEVFLQDFHFFGMFGHAATCRLRAAIKDETGHGVKSVRSCRINLMLV